MKLLSRNILAMILAGFAGTSALAGPNAGGALILHTDDSIVFSQDTDYAGASGRDCVDDFNCPDNPDVVCESQSSNPTSGKALAEAAVWWVLAAFDPDSCPLLKGITFGVSWDSPGTNIGIADFGPSGDVEIELASDSWPDWTGTGTAITWVNPGRTRLKEVYWFAGYAYYGPGTFRIGPHPTQGANFADNAVPSNVDPIFPEMMGFLGLGGATGFNPAPGGGACCAPGLVCTIETEEDCVSQGFNFMGLGVPCTPQNPCAVPVIDKSWGSVKKIFSGQ